MAFAVAIFGFLIMLASIGFTVGYMGTWRDSVKVVGIMLALFLVPQTAMRFLMHAPMTKGLGGDLVLVWLVTLGALIGTIAGKKDPIKKLLSVHAALAVGSTVLIQALDLIFRY